MASAGLKSCEIAMNDINFKLNPVLRVKKLTFKSCIQALNYAKDIMKYTKKFSLK